MLFEVDELGLDKVDRAILTALCVTFSGRPVGLHTLAVAVAEEPDTLEDVYEPFLLTAGLLDRTPRGPDRHPGGVCAPFAAAADPSAGPHICSSGTRRRRTRVARHYTSSALPLHGSTVGPALGISWRSRSSTSPSWRWRSSS